MKKFAVRFIAIVMSFIIVIPVNVYGDTDHNNKTQLWWIINAARGSGEFSYEFELAPSAAQIEAGTHGQRGIVEGSYGVVRVFNRTEDGIYIEATNSVAMALFARNFRLLTQCDYNNNNVDQPRRPAQPFPEWLGLTENGEAFGDANFELFPLITHETLMSADYAFDIYLRSPDTDRENAMLFIFDGGVMSAVHFVNHNGDSVFKRISNLRPALSGIAPASRSTKTYLWWIIDAARGNGSFSFDFEFEDGTRGRMTGENGVIRAFDEARGEVPDSPALTVFGSRFALLTQLNHNHNNPIDGVRPYEPPFPTWLGLTDNGVGFVNSNYELFPLITPETLASAANPFEMNLPSPDPDREHAMLFIYDGGAMSAVQFRDPATGDYTFMRISNLQKNAGNNITRQEFVQTAMSQVVYALGGTVSEIVDERGIPERMGHTFSDTADPYVMFAYQIGIINGMVAPTDNNPGVFNPAGVLTRQHEEIIITNMSRVVGG